MIPESYEAMGVDPGDRKPVFAVLRIGRKDAQKGHPIDKGNFYVVDPQARDAKFQKRGGEYSAPYRADSEAFIEFNSKSARTTFHGILPYPQLEQCWEVRRRAATLPKFPQHPDTFLTCESCDGETAKRYTDGDDGPEWAEIDCPGHLCEFAQSGECKTRAWLYFIANEPGCPRVLMRYHTGGQSTTVQNIGAFFADLDRMAAGTGRRITNFQNIPFVLTLAPVKIRSKNRLVAVVSMALDGSITDVSTLR